MKEYGGYLEMEHYNGLEFHNNAIKLNSARNALRYLIKIRNIKSIYLPYYTCDSIEDACTKENIQINYYEIDDNFKPIFDKVLDDNEYIYIINYYGMISNDDVISYKNKYKNIIFDNIQSFFQERVDGVDTIYTCRKFFGVTDGAYLYTDCDKKLELETDKSYDRVKYLVGRYENDAGSYYQDYQKNEELLDNLDIMYMSKITENILRSIDYDYVINKRKENFNYLHDNLKDINKININIINNNGLYMYPLLIDDGYKIRKKLQEKKIFIPCLWPNVGEDRTDAYYKAQNILPIPCDQRYDINDMLYLINEIKKEIQ